MRVCARNTTQYRSTQNNATYYHTTRNSHNRTHNAHTTAQHSTAAQHSRQPPTTTHNNHAHHATPHRNHTGRAQPIDILYKNINASDMEHDFDMNEPYKIFQSLELRELEDLQSDIQMYFELDEHKVRAVFCVRVRVYARA